MHYLTSAPNAKAVAAQLWRSWQLEPKQPNPAFHENEPGVIRFEANIDTLSPSAWMFGIMCMLGHAIVV
jgi:hypothetical protein